MTKSVKKEIEQIILSALSKMGENVAFAYLFGSICTEHYQHGKSDIDLAIYFYDPLTFDEVNRLRTEIQKLITDHPEVDIIQMQEAGWILNHQILAKGQLLLENDAKLHQEFVLKQLNLYADLKISRRQMEKEIDHSVLDTFKSSNDDR